MRRKVERRQLPGCVPFGLSDREFLILGEKNTGGGAEDIHTGQETRFTSG